MQWIRNNIRNVKCRQVGSITVLFRDQISFLKTGLLFSLFICVLFLAPSRSLQGQSDVLNIGDPAPPLKVQAWLKGRPVHQFERGKVYILEFWATWCKPCLASMPHLSALAEEYKEKAVFLGINVHEKKNTSLPQLQHFTDSLGKKMNYPVAVDHTGWMVQHWLDATGERDNGIPNTIVVDANGKIAWIGHPMKLDKVLPAIINNNWNHANEAHNRTRAFALREKDAEAGEYLNRFVADPFVSGDKGNPDSALYIIEELTHKEPALRFMPRIAFHTFSSLLKTNREKAVSYGAGLLQQTENTEPDCYAIIDVIKYYSAKMKLPPAIYQLGARAYQLRISQFVFPELVNLPGLYQKMAEWYWLAGDKQMAIRSIHTALSLISNVEAYAKTETAELELQLRLYTADNTMINVGQKE
jgi:thiol-disulfide isomerase/thioredoxin